MEDAYSWTPRGAMRQTSRTSRHPEGLGVYAEQTEEAAHKDFLKTWKRLKVRKTHCAHAERLKRAVVYYCSKQFI